MAISAERRSTVLPAALLALGLAGEGRAETPSWLAEVRERGSLSISVDVESAYGYTDTRAQKSEIVLEPELQFSLPFDLELTAIGRGRADAYDRLEPGHPDEPEASDASRRAFVLCPGLCRREHEPHGDAEDSP